MDNQYEIDVACRPYLVISHDGDSYTATTDDVRRLLLEPIRTISANKVVLEGSPRITIRPAMRGGGPCFTTVRKRVS
jgi:hypothetical protein